MPFFNGHCAIAKLENFDVLFWNISFIIVSIHTWHCHIFSVKHRRRKNRKSKVQMCYSLISPSSSSSSTPRMYNTLLHLIRTSPRLPERAPSMYSSVFASCKFMYPSTDTRNPLYSIPHFSLTMTGFPVRPLRKGFGLRGRADVIISLCQFGTEMMRI